MGTKGITTAAKNFFYAWQRVQGKLGENKTGNMPPTTTPADRRGGPRPGPGERRARRCTPQPPRRIATVLALAPGKRRRTRIIPVLAADESAPQAHGASLLPTLMALLVASPRG